MDRDEAKRSDTLRSTISSAQPQRALKPLTEAPTDTSETRDPPKTVRGILRELGPGLIIAGSIVGSGELIATTAVGAEAGFTLLWLIIIGCVIKVFAQIEFGRYTIVNGRTTMDGLNEVPGPRRRIHSIFGWVPGSRARVDRSETSRQMEGNWIIWCWLVFMVVALAQLGGIIGGVGQALAIQQPLTEQGRTVNDYHDNKIRVQVLGRLIARLEADPGTADRVAQLAAEREVAERIVTKIEARTEDDREPRSDDALIWATIITLGSIVLLVIGRYGLIQTVSTALVAGFTFLTVGNLIHLQRLPDWRVGWDDLILGLSFTLPSGNQGITTALAAFGIIGVGATELIQYPYWCMEKGYARWTGPRDDSEQWAQRAKGWLRVLRWDAWVSMVIYTFATVAFYLLGAAILGRTGLNPSGAEMVRTLSEMYVPVFGEWSQPVFLVGAFAILYSTFFIGTASHARVCADAMRVFGLSAGGEKAYRRWTTVFCIVFPLLFLATFAFFQAPKQLVLAGGFMGSMMFPLLGIAALHFRYSRSDDRLKPGKLWDFCLWISFAGFLIVGGWGLYAKVILSFIGSEG